MREGEEGKLVRSVGETEGMEGGVKGEWRGNGEG